MKEDWMDDNQNEFDGGWSDEEVKEDLVMEKKNTLCDDLVNIDTQKGY